MTTYNEDGRMNRKCSLIRECKEMLTTFKCSGDKCPSCGYGESPEDYQCVGELTLTVPVS